MFWHTISAWNTGGEGIHSPLLFYIVRYLFYETSQLYAWQAIEHQRMILLNDHRKIHVEDFGTGRDRDTRVKDIASRSLMDRSSAQRIARLLHYMNGKEYVVGREKRLHILELGTSLGITTAYMASIDSRNRVVSFEGSQAIANLAVRNWDKQGIKNIRLIVGPIDDTLINYAREEHDPIDFALMDANHRGDATLRYFEWLLPKMDPNGIIAIDDIRYSRDMYKAWQTITKHTGVTATMDLGRMGLVFLYPAVQQKTYLLRV